MKQLFLSICLLSAGILSHAAVISLSGSLSSQTLTTDNCYYLNGCVVVPAGAVLTINPGVVIRCGQASALVIARGGQIFSNGNSANPVVFTSDKAVNSRAAGDWAGITVNGYANNNIVNGGGGNLDIVRCGTTYSGGGVNDADNSGIIRYTRIEFAGTGNTGDTHTHGLVLNSVGSATELHHIQVSECAQDAFWIAGGKAEISYLVSLNAHRNDFYFSSGTQCKIQYALALRMDPNAYTGSPEFSNGIIIENAFTANSNTPYTYPLISNVSLLDPSYCGTAISGNLKNGILVRNNGHADIRNSVVSKFGNYGFYIQDAASVSNTAANTLNFSYNALMAKSPVNYATGASWTSGCGGGLSSMTAWINGSGLAGCRESGNSFTLSVLGYHTSICNNYCNTAPTLTYSGSSLNGTDFSAPFNTYFTSTSYKGAVGVTDWTNGWSAYCPQSFTYCDTTQQRTGNTGKPELRISPNPASGTVTVSFEAQQTGPAALIVSDNVSGKVLRQVSCPVSQTGTRYVRFSVSGLKDGIYPVRVRMNGQVITGQLVVRP